MDKPLNKSNESSISTTGTTGSPPFSDTMENNVKYINLNFIDNSESSSQAKEPDFQKIPLQTFEAPKPTKPPPSKILPTNLQLPGQHDSLKPDPVLKEKTLNEMGFKTNEIQGWEDIVQPPKENLYKLLKNMIDNHIKPNVQIRIGGVTFNCHMMVLQCYSDFFMECNNEVLIQLPEEKITPGAFMMVYDWMLAEEPLVQREGILELFNAANFLRIKNLVNQCWLCLDDDVRFREDTAFLLYMEARNYGLESLEQLMLTRICKFFLTLVASKEFLELNMKEICTLLSSNTIGVNSEIEIFMSVVRWLSHNWEEREAQMLNVIKCVRFSLMPPWFLVTLNKNIDCIEIDRIASHPEVKRMINDGISYTTTQLYYGENREEFLHFLERYQLIAPTQRQWVFDKECSYHHRLECPNMQYVTYKSFLEYLEMIQTIGKDYWRSLEMAKGIEKSMQCCVRSDCRKLNSQNLASVLLMKCRDQGVQVEPSIRLRKGLPAPAKDTRTLTHRESKTNLTNITRNTSKLSPTHQKNEPSYIPVAYSADETEQNNQQQQQSDEQTHQQSKQKQHKQYRSRSQQHITYNTSKNIMKDASAQKSQSGCTVVPMSNNKHNNRNQPQQHNNNEHYECEQGHQYAEVGCGDNIKEIGAGDGPKKSFRSAFLCTKSSQTMCAADDQKVDEKEQRQTLEFDKTLQEQQQYIVPIYTGHASLISSIEETEFYQITNRKILIFGGIDPYCNHCQLDKPQQQQLPQQRKRALHFATGSGGGGDSNNVSATNIGGITSETENYGDRVLFYDAKVMQWKHLCYIPFGSRHHHAAVVCNGLIYIIGGTRTALGCTKKSVFEKSVWCFDPQTLQWTFESVLPELRRDFAVIVIDNSTNDKSDENDDDKCEQCQGATAKEKRIKRDIGFYVIGGEGVNGVALDTVWFYNLEEKKWSKKASLNVGRYGLAAAMVNNEIWIAGGIIENKIRICDDENNAGDGGGGGAGGDGNIETLADIISDSMEFYRCKPNNCCDETDNGCGGNGCGHDAGCSDGGDSADCEYCSADDGQWIKSKLHLRIPRLFGRFCKMSNRELYLVGGIGFNGDDVLTSLTSIDQFNFDEEIWHHYGDINWARHGHDIGTLNDRIIIIGGVSTIKKRTLTQVEAFCLKTRKSFMDIPELPWPLSGCAVVALE